MTEYRRFKKGCSSSSFCRHYNDVIVVGLQLKCRHLRYTEGQRSNQSNTWFFSPLCLSLSAERLVYSPFSYCSQEDFRSYAIGMCFGGRRLRPMNTRFWLANAGEDLKESFMSCDIVYPPQLVVFSQANRSVGVTNTCLFSCLTRLL